MEKEKFGGLVCLDCGGELELKVWCDGMSEEAVSYDSRRSPNWAFEVTLECKSCPSVYPICRTPDLIYISGRVEDEES